MSKEDTFLGGGILSIAIGAIILVACIAASIEFIAIGISFIIKHILILIILMANSPHLAIWALGLFLVLIGIILIQHANTLR
jgi:hypothetical protein